MPDTIMRRRHVAYDPPPQAVVPPATPPVETPAPQTPVIRRAIPARQRMIDWICRTEPYTHVRGYLAASLVNWLNFGPVNLPAELAAIGADDVISSGNLSVGVFGLGQGFFNIQCKMIKSQYSDVCVILAKDGNAGAFRKVHSGWDPLANVLANGRIANSVVKVAAAVCDWVQSASPTYRPKSFLGFNWAGSVAAMCARQHQSQSLPLNDCFTFGQMPFAGREVITNATNQTVPVFDVANGFDWLRQCPFWALARQSKPWHDEFYNDTPLQRTRPAQWVSSGGLPRQLGRTASYRFDRAEKLANLNYSPASQWMWNDTTNFNDYYWAHFCTFYLHEIWASMGQEAIPSLTTFDSINSVNPSFAH